MFFCILIRQTLSCDIQVFLQHPKPNSDNTDFRI